MMLLDDETYFVDVNDVDNGDEFALVGAVGDKSDAANLNKRFEALEKIKIGHRLDRI